MLQKIKSFLFTNTSNKQTVVKNTIWLSVGEIGSRLIKLAIFVYAARVLGVTEWGTFSYAIALLGVFSILSDIGMNAIFLREVSRKSEMTPKYIATGSIIKICLSFFSSLLLTFLLLFVKNKEVATIIPLAAILLFIDSLREFGYSLNRAYEQMEYEASIKLLSSLLLAGIAIYTLFLSPNAYSLMIAYIVSGIIGLLVLYTTIKKYIIQSIHSFDKKLIRTILVQSLPIGIVSAFGIILSSIDTIFLGWLKNTTDVGYYAASQKPLQILLLIPNLISTAILPFFSRVADGDTKNFKEILGRVVLITSIIVLPLTMLFILFAQPIITTLFGSAYQKAAPLLQITSLSAVAAIPTVLISNALVAHRKQNILLRFIIIGASTNILLSLFLIPSYGIYGAAIAFTLSQFFATITLLYYSRKIPAFRFSFDFTLLKNDIKSFFKI